MQPKQFGSCRVITSIASGNVTEVFRATQLPLGRDVAIKALKPSLGQSPHFGVALEREGRILSCLRHENISRIIDYSSDVHSAWLTLELVDGVPLRQLISQPDCITVQCAIAIAIGVARALAHCHAKGVIHCNVRPSNVLVSRDGSVVLIDFGAAHADAVSNIPEPLGVDSALVLPSYMSPEQILGNRLDERSDLFALGVVLYEMLAGQRPFVGADDHSIARSIRHDEPLALDRSAIPKGLCQIVSRCLQKTPGDRFGSAGDLSAALEEVYLNLSTQRKNAVITSSLARAKLIERPSRIDDERLDPIEQPAQVPSMFPAIRMLISMLVLLAAGGVAIHVVFRSDLEELANSGKSSLMLVPSKAGSLLVIAQPWAHVVVDGQQVETTPFAKPIPLSAGVHHVTLRHPHAPDERRTVQIERDERVVLNVTMQVRRAPKPAVSAPAPIPSASTP